jgi:hypothetical protein
VNQTGGYPSLPGRAGDLTERLAWTLPESRGKRTLVMFSSPSKDKKPRAGTRVMNHTYPWEEKGRGQNNGLSGLVSVSERL